MSDRIDMHALWQAWRRCPDCDDYHVRLTALGANVRVMCEQCGFVRWLVCPVCGERPEPRDVVAANGARARRAWCVPCDRSTTEWFITQRPSRRQPLNYIVRERSSKCARCGLPLGKGDGEVHHIVPLRDGGADILSNLELLCTPCHDGEHPWRVQAYGGKR